MNRRVIILLLLIVILGGVAGAALLLRPTTTPENTPGPGQTGIPQVGGATVTPFVVVEILVTLQPIARGGPIPPEALVWKPWPTDSVPASAITRRPEKNAQDDIAERVKGKLARTDIPVEYPILTTLMVDDLSQISTIGSDAAAVIPSGLLAVSIPMDRLTGVAYAVHDGDHVDVIVSFLFVDVDEEFQSKKPNLITLVTIKQDGTIEFQKGVQGRFEASSFSQFPVVVGPSEPQRPRLLTQRTIQAALVVHVGLFPLDGQFIGKPPATPTPPPVAETGTEATKPPQAPTPTPPLPDIITLAVPPQEAIVLTWAVEARIPMTLALRPATDVAIGTTTAVTLQYILDTYAIQQPPKLPFALEPAITSIRRLILAGNDINLNNSSSSSSSSGGTPGQ